MAVIRCPKCKGNGWSPDGHGECYVCKGSGAMYDDKIVPATWADSEAFFDACHERTESAGPNFHRYR
jgi:DnaJ-class molecular chaperone